MDFEIFLNRLICEGSIEVALPGGRRIVAGDGSAPRVSVAITDSVTLAKIVAHPSLGAGEAYMDGRLIVERGTIFDLIDLASRNIVMHIPIKTLMVPVNANAFVVFTFAKLFVTAGPDNPIL